MHPVYLKNVAVLAFLFFVMFSQKSNAQTDKIQKLTQAIQQKPDNAYAWRQRGYEYYRQKKYEQALADYTQAIRLDNTSINTYTDRANVYSRMGRFDSALADCGQALKLDSTRPGAWTTRASVFSQIKNYDAAAADYTKAIGLDNTNYSLWEMRGFFYLFSGLKNNLDLAVADYEQAFKLCKADKFKDNDFVLSEKKGFLYNIGWAYERQDRFGKAVTAFTQLIQLDRNDAFSWWARSGAYHYEGKYEQGISDLKKAISLVTKNDKNIGDYYIDIMWQLFRSGNINEAKEYYQAYSNDHLSIDPASDRYGRRAIGDVLTGNYTGAIQQLKETEKTLGVKDRDSTIMIGSDFADILVLKAYCLVQLGQLGEAKAAYEQAHLLNKSQPDIIAGIQSVNDRLLVIARQDTTSPQIIILEPAQRSVIVESDAGRKQLVRGKAIHRAGIKELLINNAPVAVEASGYFETSLALNDGVNKFVIQAMSNNGKSSVKEINIDRSKSEQQHPENIAVIPQKAVYHAILIAEDNYSNACLNDLLGPVEDMRRLYNILSTTYTFEPRDMDTLVNATRQNILEKLIAVGNQMTDNDNLFIFYAGHGKVALGEDGGKTGSLLPSNADCQDTATQLTANTLKEIIKNMQGAKHILFLADACFAGTLFRLPSDAPKDTKVVYEDKSREFMASSSDRPVPDNSLFIKMFIEQLQNYNEDKYPTSEKIFDSFKHLYREKTQLNPLLQPISDIAGSDGGKFVFIKR